MSPGADPEGTAGGRGRDLSGKCHLKRQRHRAETPKASKAVGNGGEPRPKRISVLSKRHRTPVVETFVVN